MLSDGIDKLGQVVTLATAKGMPTMVAAGGQYLSHLLESLYLAKAITNTGD